MRVASGLTLGADMSALGTAIAVVWVLFVLYWLLSATRAKRGTRNLRSAGPRAIVIVFVVLLARVFGVHDAAVHAAALAAVGTAIFLAGIGLAVWARIYLGRNWGMPMTEKDEPELVTSGPYSLVRHPIYSGILLATVGTALATNVYWLLTSVALGAYFLYAAKVEEALMERTFPAAYPSYRARTKMLIPFVL